MEGRVPRTKHIPLLTRYSGVRQMSHGRHVHTNITSEWLESKNNICVFHLNHNVDMFLLSSLKKKLQLVNNLV